MKGSKKCNMKKRWNIEWCGIKKSIKEEMTTITDTLKYREYFKLEEETTLFDKILYWFIFIVGTSLYIYLSAVGIYGKVVEYFLIYIVLNLFLSAWFYSCRWEIVKKVYGVVSKPLRVVLTCFFKLLGIDYVIQHSLKCFVSLFASGFIGIRILSVMPSCIPLFGNVITSIFSKAEVALEMCMLCSIIISIIAGMLVMYIMLRAMLVVFVSGDQL